MNKEQAPPYFISVQSGIQSQPPQHGYLSQPRTGIVYQPPKLNWCEDSVNNKPQSSSLAAASAIFASGGMSLAWSLGFSPEHTYLNESAQTHVQICWFLAVIIGACLGTVFIDKFEKRILNLWASGLVLINGIFFVSAPSSLVSIVFARYFDGMAVGLTIITTIVAGSEQAVKRFRGIVLITESIGIMIGFMLKTIFVSFWDTDWSLSSNQMQGILALILGISALLCTTFLTIESPVFYLRQGKEEDAVHALRRLKTPSEVTHETISLLYENKELIREDDNRGRMENMALGYLPIVKLCLYRAFVSMSFSLPLNWGLILASTLVDATADWWSLYMYGTMRMIGVVVNLFLVDTVGRKIPTATAMLVGGGLLMGVGSLFVNNENMADESKMHAITALLITYQLLSGIAAPANSVYLGEAFSISVKPFFILVAVIFENVIQIIICCAFRYSSKSVADYSFTLGTFQMVFAICFVIIMPETKQTTLREALKKFKRKINITYR